MSLLHKGDKGYDAKLAYNREYRRTKYGKVLLEVKHEVKDGWSEQAKAEGKTLRGFIRDCIEEHMERVKKEEEQA